MSCPQDRDKTIVRLPIMNCALGGSSQIDQKGAIADALSTAFMIMSEPDIAKLCAAHPGVGAAVACNEQSKPRPCQIKTIGHWPDQTPKQWCQCES